MVSRLSKICSTNRFYDEDIQLLKNSFIESGYPLQIVNKQLKKAIITMNKSLRVAKIDRLNDGNNRNDDGKVLYFGLQYKSQQSDIFMARIKSIVKRFFRILD